MTSNPTRSSGWFYDSFHGKQHLYETIRIDSRETPNFKGSPFYKGDPSWEHEDPIDGLADPSWLSTAIEHFGGEDSAQFAVRVKGSFLLSEQGKVLSLDALMGAAARWDRALAVGQLYIGVDPAGDTGEGDDSVFAIRRGPVIFPLRARRGISASDHVDEVLAIIAEHKDPSDHTKPVISLDSEGAVGAKVYPAFVQYLAQHPGEFHLSRIRSSEKALRQPAVYDRLRDELWANVAAWVRAGGCLPSDLRLERELHCAQWLSPTIRGLIKVTRKEDMKRDLGHSPDRADAVTLCCWEPLAIRQHLPRRDESSERVDAMMNEERVRPRIDPYAGLNTWHR
jgi:hypothetical protein